MLMGKKQKQKQKKPMDINRVPSNALKLITTNKQKPLKLKLNILNLNSNI